MNKKSLSTKNKHKRDKYVRTHKDYAENHIYLINGKSHVKLGYYSVTGFMEQFFEVFDAELTVDKYYDQWQETPHPKYFGKSKEEIILSWKINGEEARNRGTAMHEVFENHSNQEKTNEELPELLSFINWYKQEVSEPFRTEYTVYGTKERLVGNVDFIYINKDGEMCIVDYKCSRVPSNASYGRKCAILNLPDTKIAKNTLQLNIYKYLLEKYYGLEIKHIYNLYIKDYNCQFVEQKILNLGSLFNHN